MQISGKVDSIPFFSFPPAPSLTLSGMSTSSSKSILPMAIFSLNMISEHYSHIYLVQELLIASMELHTMQQINCLRSQGNGGRSIIV